MDGAPTLGDVGMLLFWFYFLCCLTLDILFCLYFCFCLPAGILVRHFGWFGTFSLLEKQNLCGPNINWINLAKIKGEYNDIDI